MRSFMPLVFVMLASATVASPIKEPAVNLKLNLRTRVEAFKGSSQWDEVRLKREFAAAETAIVICDMWDKHWCASATRRCGEIAKRMAPVLEAARRKGVTIIHAPSDTMAFYKDSPQRKRMQEVPKAEPPPSREVTEGPLPIDDSDGGCDDVPQCRQHSAWSREHPRLRVADEDGISDNGSEVYNYLKQRGIRNILIMGVHTNMCVLGRSFAIRQMTRWGMNCVLVRDLTDTMYNPRMRPLVPHGHGTELVIEHIEKYWCPTVLSRDLLR